MKKGIRGGKSEAWNELKEMVKFHKRTENLILVCWCKPKACHGDVIQKAIEWMIEQGL
jgi:hypothetical protein